MAHVARDLAVRAVRGGARRGRGVGMLLHTTLDLPDFVRQAHVPVGPRRPGPSCPQYPLRRIWRLGRPRVGPLSLRSPSRSRMRCEATASLSHVLFLRPYPDRPRPRLAGHPAHVSLRLHAARRARARTGRSAQDAAILAALAAARVPRPRLPAPGALSSRSWPSSPTRCSRRTWARRWEGHPGNEPKTLRMAVALGHGLTLDVEGVYAGMEALHAPLLSVGRGVRRAASTRESARMAVGRSRTARRAVGASAIRATRITRQTIRGKEGGVYHVLAPGPVAAARARAARRPRAEPRAGHAGPAGGDRGSLERAGRGAGGGACSSSRATGERARAWRRRWPAWPRCCRRCVFYSYQFYPEMLGALFLAVALRAILLRPWDGAAHGARARPPARLPALAPPEVPARVGGARASMAVVRAVDALVTLRTLMALLVPQVVSLYLIALYNFGITGSVRPDALFLAWGPARRQLGALGPGAVRPRPRRALRPPALRARVPARAGRPRPPPARRACARCAGAPSCRWRRTT